MPPSHDVVPGWLTGSPPSGDDATTHEMDSDPHPEHSDCPALNQIDFLNPGQSRSGGNLTTARNCGFHDHLNPNNGSLRGTVTIR